MSFALIVAAAPIQWGEPSKWPPIVWVWLAMLLLGCGKPVWQWYRRQQVQGWPIAQGRIESVEVKPPQKRGGPARAELAYSYSLEGQYYSGYYNREFGSEDEGLEFVRDLKGKSVVVSYNPRNSAKSLLSEGAVADLLNTRPLRPAGEFQVKVSVLPEHAKPPLRPLIVISGVGLGLSLWVHVGAMAGRRIAPEALFWMLHMGIFVVWIPAVLVIRQRFGIYSGKNRLTLALREAPAWMRYMVYAFFGYAMVNFVIFVPQMPQGDGNGKSPLVVAHLFSIVWMVFYSAALAVHYSTTGIGGDKS